MQGRLMAILYTFQEVHGFLAQGCLGMVLFLPPSFLLGGQTGAVVLLQFEEGGAVAIVPESKG